MSENDAAERDLKRFQFGVTVLIKTNELFFHKKDTWHG